MADTVLGLIQIQALIDANPVDGYEYLHVKQGTADRKVTILDAMKPHTDDHNNPHNVTKYQVQLGNVTNDAQLKRDSNLSDIPSKEVARNNLYVYSIDESDEILRQHVEDYDNPHHVTKQQVQLGNVPNYSPSNDFKENADKFATSRAVYALFKAIQDEKPVNSLHITFDPRDPGTYLLCGGTWELVSKGQALVGFDPAVPARAVGSTFGTATKQISVANLPKHSHGISITSQPHSHVINGQTVGAGAHAHTFAGSTSIFDYGVRGGSTDVRGGHAHNGSTTNSGAHRHTFGGDNDMYYFNEVAQNQVALYDAHSSSDRWARYYWTGWGGEHSHTFVTNVAGDHNHNVAVEIGAHGHNFSGTTGGVGDHQHTVNFWSQPAQVAVTGTSDQTGSDTPLSVEQPSLVVYIWRRTA